MADIAELGELQSSEPLDLDLYPDTRERPPLPPAGTYTLQAPETFVFGKTKKEGNDMVFVDPTILGPTGTGQVVRFARLSFKTFLSQGKVASQVGNYLRAFGMRGKLNLEEQKEAVTRTANLTYKAQLDWRAYEKATGFVKEGMTNFPSDGNGSYQPWVPSPTTTDPVTGEPVRVWANLVVKRFIVADGQP